MPSSTSGCMKAALEQLCAMKMQEQGRCHIAQCRAGLLPRSALHPLHGSGCKELLNDLQHAHSIRAALTAERAGRRRGEQDASSLCAAGAVSENCKLRKASARPRPHASTHPAPAFTHCLPCPVQHTAVACTQAPAGCRPGWPASPGARRPEDQAAFRINRRPQASPRPPGNSCTGHAPAAPATKAARPAPCPSHLRGRALPKQRGVGLCVHAVPRACEIAAAGRPAHAEASLGGLRSGGRVRISRPPEIAPALALSSCTLGTFCSADGCPACRPAPTRPRHVHDCALAGAVGKGLVAEARVCEVDGRGRQPHALGRDRALHLRVNGPAGRRGRTRARLSRHHGAASAQPKCSPSITSRAATLTSRAAGRQCMATGQSAAQARRPCRLDAWRAPCGQPPRALTRHSRRPAASQLTTGSAQTPTPPLACLAQ